MKNYNRTKVILSLMILIYLVLGLIATFNLIAPSHRVTSGSFTGLGIFSSTALVTTLILLRDILKEEKEK